MWESETLVILPHPIYDPQEFGGLADLNFIGRKEGYYGGMRLLMATCKKVCASSSCCCCCCCCRSFPPLLTLN